MLNLKYPAGPQPNILQTTNSQDDSVLEYHVVFCISSLKIIILVENDCKQKVSNEPNDDAIRKHATTIIHCFDDTPTKQYFTPLQ